MSVFPMQPALLCYPCCRCRSMAAASSEACAELEQQQSKKADLVAQQAQQAVATTAAAAAKEGSTRAGLANGTAATAAAAAAAAAVAGAEGTHTEAAAAPATVALPPAGPFEQAAGLGPLPLGSGRQYNQFRQLSTLPSDWQPSTDMASPMAELLGLAAGRVGRRRSWEGPARTGSGTSGGVDVASSTAGGAAGTAGPDVRQRRRSLEEATAWRLPWLGGGAGTSGSVRSSSAERPAMGPASGLLAKVEEGQVPARQAGTLDVEWPGEAQEGRSGDSVSAAGGHVPGRAAQPHPAAPTVQQGAGRGGMPAGLPLGGGSSSSSARWEPAPYPSP